MALIVTSYQPAMPRRFKRLSNPVHLPSRPRPVIPGAGLTILEVVRCAARRGLSGEKLATIVAGERPTDLTRQEAVAYDFAIGAGQTAACRRI
jgi:hypothetical protein